MFKRVEIPSSLLEIVSTKTWFSSEQPDGWFNLIGLIGILSLLALCGEVLRRLSRPEGSGSEFDRLRDELGQVLRSTFFIRLTVLCASIVIPLIFYVNTKEHYWTAKHMAMLFAGFLGLCVWLAVCRWIPRFRTPFVWPVAVILLSATLSMLRAVNTAEGIGYLFAIFGSAVFFFLASQTFTTSKRIHLFVLNLAVVGLVMSLYGLCQSYLLLPMDYVYAQDTRAPVSTIGNKNYAAYYLDLAIPLALALAACRRSPWQTLLALTIYFYCRWHFTICDTRGGTISMTVAVITVICVVAWFHGRRFRLLLYALLLEPLLWAAASAAKLTYADVQQWGALLNRPENRGQIGRALRENLPTEYEPIASILQQSFLKANEVALGVPVRFWALALGILVALAVFHFLLKVRTDWISHLGAAFGLAILPYLFANFTMPNLRDEATMAARVMDYVRNGGVAEYGVNSDLIIQMLNQYKLILVQAARDYNSMFLVMHQNAAAMISLTLFVVMAGFLLYRHYDHPEGWLPGFAVVGAIAAWFVLFIFLCTGSPLSERLGDLDSIWTKSLFSLHRDHPILGFFFTTTSFAIYSIVGLLAAIFITQWIPAHLPEEETNHLAATAKDSLRFVIPAAVIIIIVGFVLTKDVRESVKDGVRTAKAEGVVEGIFEMGHRFFNTRDQDKTIPRDGAIGFRLEIYQSCFRKMKDSWNTFLGIGPGNFKVIHPFPRFETALERRILGKEVLGRKAHNDFLEDAVENGAFGFMGLVWMFSMTGFLLYRSLKRIHPPRDASDVFVNTITWGLCGSMTAILIHAQFEAPLLQPASTYPCWMLFGIVFQLHRIQRLRTVRAAAGLPGVVRAETPVLLTESKPDIPLPSAASYELPSAKPLAPAFAAVTAPSVAWPVALVIVTLITGSILVRQYVGETWLRWGMIFSQSGIERFNDVFTCMEKAQDIYPQQMETNYILGRYCIDATQYILPVWEKLYGPSSRVPALRAEGEREAREVLQARYQLDANKLIDYAELGVKVHKRDLFMNPNYKWAHNNLGVLCDKLAQIYKIKASMEVDAGKKKEFEDLSAQYETESRKCYRTALEIDDLQVYALFNLGIGAYRRGELGRAQRFFERTLLADPGKGDVNLFIAKCRLALEDFKGGVEACQALFAWADRHPRNRLSKEDSEEVSQLLEQVARLSLAGNDLEVARMAVETLIQSVDRCKHLPLLARVEADSGNAQKAIELADEADNQCERSTLSAESFFARAKAHCLLEDATSAVDILNSLMVREEIARHFVDLIRNDSTFDILKDTEFYRTHIPAASPDVREATATRDATGEVEAAPDASP